MENSFADIWMALLGLLLMLVGVLTFMIGKIPAAMDSYKNGRHVWGALIVVSVLFPPIGLVYCLLYLKKNRLAFVLMLTGFVLMSGGCLMVFPHLSELWRQTKAVFGIG